MLRYALSQIIVTIKHMTYKGKRILGRRWMTRAAVAIVKRKHPTLGEQILLMKRAERPGDPWSGDMAFPGGKSSPLDSNVYQTALRELYEEVGLPADALSDAGRISDQLTKTHSGKRPMAVSPFVFELQHEVQLELNHEATETLWVPLSHFQLPANRESMYWKVRGVNIKVPCYWYKQRRIWGLTLRMIDELARQ